MQTISIRTPRAYHGGGFFQDIGPRFDRLERRHAIINADVVDAWYDPSPRVIEAVSGCLPWLLKTSPPTHAEGLVEAISEVRGIPADCLLVGGGSSDLMYLAFPHLLSPGERVVILDPMYGEYAHILEHVVDADVRRCFLDRRSGFAPDLDALLAQAAGAAMVVLVNPNNPTGTCVTAEFMQALRAGLDPRALLFIDETYIDYVSPSPSMERRVADHDNLIILKSMSKFYALSGARVAYLAASPAIIAHLSVSSPPWPVGLPAQVAAVAALGDEAYYRQRIRLTHRLRERLAADLRSLPGLRVYDSIANFILMQLLDGGAAAESVYQAMKLRGVHIRNCDSQSLQFNGDFIRTAVKDAAANQRIAAALREVLEEVAPSFRQP